MQYEMGSKFGWTVDSRMRDCVRALLPSALYTHSVALCVQRGSCASPSLAHEAGCEARKLFLQIICHRRVSWLAASGEEHFNCRNRRTFYALSLLCCSNSFSSVQFFRSFSFRIRILKKRIAIVLSRTNNFDSNFKKRLGRAHLWFYQIRNFTMHEWIEGKRKKRRKKSSDSTKLNSRFVVRWVCVCVCVCCGLWSLFVQFIQ